jgi:hypothetical protein
MALAPVADVYADHLRQRDRAYDQLELSSALPALRIHREEQLQQVSAKRTPHAVTSALSAAGRQMGL